MATDAVYKGAAPQDTDTSALPDIAHADLDELIEHERLLLDNPRRYEKGLAEDIVRLSPKRTAQLIRTFPDIQDIGFTLEGMPAEYERQLTRGLWVALTQTEKDEILARTTAMVSRQDGANAEKLPDQTPYAMRLTHLFLQSR